MKLDSFLLISKAICYFLIGFGTPMGAGLVQWANSHEWPDKITWVALFISAGVGGATSMLAFFSGAYSDYVKARAIPTESGPSTADNAANPKPLKDP